MFQRSISVGSTVDVVFDADRSNSGTTAVVVTFGPDDGAPVVKTVLAAPGGRARTSVDVEGVGFLRVRVDAKSADDKGVLKVDDGQSVDEDDDFTGDDSWLYAVE